MSKITISRSAWHVRLYKFIYGSYSSLPSSLCPYFWKLLAGMLFILPLAPIAMAAYVLAGICKLFKWDLVSLRTLNLFYRVGFGLLLITGMLILSIAGTAIYHLYTHRKLIEGEAFCLVLSIFAIVLISTVNISMVIQNNKERKEAADREAWLAVNSDKEPWEYFREHESIKNDGFFTLIGKAIKAWYNKNCPIIHCK